MQPLLVVHIFNKMPDVSECLFKCLVFIEINLLDLQGFYKTFNKYIVIRISFSRHADLDVMHLKAVYIILRCILNALIRMMNEIAKAFIFCSPALLPEYSWPGRFLSSCSDPIRCNFCCIDPEQLGYRYAYAATAHRGYPKPKPGSIM